MSMEQNKIDALGKYIAENAVREPTDHDSKAIERVGPDSFYGAIGIAMFEADIAGLRIDQQINFVGNAAITALAKPSTTPDVAELMLDLEALLPSRDGQWGDREVIYGDVARRSLDALASLSAQLADLLQALADTHNERADLLDQLAVREDALRRIATVDIGGRGRSAVACRNIARAAISPQAYAALGDK